MNLQHYGAIPSHVMHHLHEIDKERHRAELKLIQANGNVQIAIDSLVSLYQDPIRERRKIDAIAEHLKDPLDSYKREVYIQFQEPRHRMILRTILVVQDCPEYFEQHSYRDPRYLRSATDIERLKNAGWDFGNMGR